MCHDFAQVHADDAFLDALGTGEPTFEVAEDDLSVLLVSWRAAVDAEPIGWPVEVLDWIYKRCA